MSYLITVLMIGALVFVHELGHLLAAWSVGIPVARFSIGFGPVLWTWRRNGVEYCVSLIPLGGYVLPTFEDEAAFFRISTTRRILFWLGGPLANFVSAGLLLTIASGAANGVSLYGLMVEPWMQVVGLTERFLAALPAIFARPDQLSGIIGIVAVGNTVVGAGFQSALRFAVLLNLNLAIFNLLPIAPLDGGKIFCSMLEKIHPRLARLHTSLAVVGLVLLFVLMAYTTVLDVVRQLA